MIRAFSSMFSGASVEDERPQAEGEVAEPAEPAFALKYSTRLQDAIRGRLYQRRSVGGVDFTPYTYSTPKTTAETHVASAHHDNDKNAEPTPLVVATTESSSSASPTAVPTAAIELDTDAQHKTINATTETPSQQAKSIPTSAPAPTQTPTTAAIAPPQQDAVNSQTTSGHQQTRTPPPTHRQSPPAREVAHNSDDQTHERLERAREYIAELEVRDQRLQEENRQLKVRLEESALQKLSAVVQETRDNVINTRERRRQRHCVSEGETLTECYRQHAVDPLSCAHAVRAYAQCAETAKTLAFQRIRLQAQTTTTRL